MTVIIIICNFYLVYTQPTVAANFRVTGVSVQCNIMSATGEFIGACWEAILYCLEDIYGIIIMKMNHLLFKEQ